jgi:hypothetical protein
VPRRPRDPLATARRLLVDGTNLGYAARRGQAPVPPIALIGRLRAATPRHIEVEIVFDGPPDPGMRGTRIAAGVTVRHATRRSADELLLELAQPGDLVVTDDRELRDGLAARGAESTGTAWLLDRLARGKAVSPSISGRRRPGMQPREEPDSER